MFSHSGPSGIMGFGRKQNLLKPVVGGMGFVDFPFIILNRCNETEPAVVKLCRFCLFLKDTLLLFFRISDRLLLFNMETVNILPIN